MSLRLALTSALRRAPRAASARLPSTARMMIPTTTAPFAASTVGSHRGARPRPVVAAHVRHGVRPASSFAISAAETATASSTADIDVDAAKAAAAAQGEAVRSLKEAAKRGDATKDDVDAAVGGGGRGLAGLEKARKSVVATPLVRWERILEKCAEITEGEGGGAVLAYFKLHTNVKHHAWP